MAYKIVVDSCCDISEDMKAWSNFEAVPLTLQIGDYIVMDNADFNQDDFIGRMTASSELAIRLPLPRSVCKGVRG